MTSAAKPSMVRVESITPSESIPPSSQKLPCCNNLGFLVVVLLLCGAQQPHRLLVSLRVIHFRIVQRGLALEKTLHDLVSALKSGSMECGHARRRHLIGQGLLLYEENHTSEVSVWQKNEFCVA